MNNNKNFYSVKNKLSKKLHFSLDNINFKENDLNDEVNKDIAKILQNRPPQISDATQEIINKKKT